MRNSLASASRVKCNNARLRWRALLWLSSNLAPTSDQQNPERSVSDYQVSWHQPPRDANVKLTRKFRKMDDAIFNGVNYKDHKIEITPIPASVSGGPGYMYALDGDGLLRGIPVASLNECIRFAKEAIDAQVG